ncbi:aspartate/glutamate racemase family protein [Sinosporangium album]|uniref:aspartate/glutamate racemase family protein n=1 Tax=Sinosporangium album TaxID=504805 RepID=UPI0030B85AD5
MSGSAAATPPTASSGRSTIRDRGRPDFRRPLGGDERVQLISDLVDKGAEGVILGCTEIELLVSEKDTPVPVLPSARLHAEAAVDFALAG